MPAKKKKKIQFAHITLRPDSTQRKHIALLLDTSSRNTASGAILDIVGRWPEKCSQLDDMSEERDRLQDELMSLKSDLGALEDDLRALLERIGQGKLELK